MRIPTDAGSRMLLALCMLMSIAVLLAQTDALACGRGHLMRPGDTCAWTIEGDDVEVHVDAQACALVTSKNYRMRYSHPGPRLCPGGPDFSRPGLSPVAVADTIVGLDAGGAAVRGAVDLDAKHRLQRGDGCSCVAGTGPAGAGAALERRALVRGGDPRPGMDHAEGAARAGLPRRTAAGGGLACAGTGRTLPWSAGEPTGSTCGKIERSRRKSGRWTRTGRATRWPP